MEELTKLPDKWCIKITKDNREILYKYWITLNPDTAYSGHFKDWFISDRRDGSYMLWGESSLYVYKEITLDQFKKWVLKEEPKIDSFCVQVTEENSTVVHKWYNNPVAALKSGSYVGVRQGIKSWGPEYSMFPQHFDKFLTTEEFYEKIGHKVSLVGRWLKALVNNPQSTPFKKGEYAEIKHDYGVNTIAIYHPNSNFGANKSQFGEQWELMPEGFAPSQENKSIVCGVELIPGEVYYFSSHDSWLIEFDRLKNRNIMKHCSLCLGNNVFYHHARNWGSMDNIKSIRLATQEEKEHLLACKAAGKYVDKPEKKYDYEVVHCTTQQEWILFAKTKYQIDDKVIDLMGREAIITNAWEVIGESLYNNGNLISQKY